LKRAFRTLIARGEAPLRSHSHQIHSIDQLDHGEVTGGVFVRRSGVICPCPGMRPFSSLVQNVDVFRWITINASSSLHGRFPSGKTASIWRRELKMSVSNIKLKATVPTSLKAASEREIENKDRCFGRRNRGAIEISRCSGWFRKMVSTSHMQPTAKSS